MDRSVHIKNRVAVALKINDLQDLRVQSSFFSSGDPKLAPDPCAWSDYENPPRPHAKWEAHKWEHRKDGYVLVEGRWK